MNLLKAQSEEDVSKIIKMISKKVKSNTAFTHVSFTQKMVDLKRQLMLKIDESK